MWVKKENKLTVTMAGELESYEAAKLGCRSVGRSVGQAGGGHVSSCLNTFLAPGGQKRGSALSVVRTLYQHL
jgi:hypothetical protein